MRTARCTSLNHDPHHLATKADRRVGMVSWLYVYDAALDCLLDNFFIG